MKVHELCQFSSRMGNYSIYCTPQVFVERGVLKYSTFSKLCRFIQVLSIVYSLVRDYACGQVLRAILCYSYRLRPAQLHGNSLVPSNIQPLCFKFSIHRERKGLVMLQPSSCCHSRNLMWPIRSMLFVDYICCHGVQLRHNMFLIADVSILLSSHYVQ